MFSTERSVPSKRLLTVAILPFVSVMPAWSAIAAQQITPATQKKSSPPATGKTLSESTSNGTAAQIKAIVASGNLNDLRWPDFTDYRTHLNNFYRPTGYQPAWIRDGKPTAQALELIRILSDADQKGLHAEDYDASRWAGREAALDASPAPADTARFDVALTVAVMRYVSDLHIGRINPQHVGFEFDVSHKKLNLPGFIREELVNGSDLGPQLDAVEPPFPSYQRLRTALQHYRELQSRNGDGEKVLDVGNVSPGGSYAGVAGLAARLRLLGDLPESVTIAPDATVYDGPLVDAVKHFQGRVNIIPSGELSYKTVVELNVPLTKRIEQMQFGLERYRWLPYTFRQPPVVVNVPEFRLYGFEKGYKLGITMRVNVGEDYSLQTPMFENNIQYIIFRPYWTPTPKIVRDDIIPQIQKTPSLDENGLELVSANGKVIRSGLITPAMMQQIRTGKLTVRQPPGTENGMGLVKFMFPNQHNVYMHDIPASSDSFAKAGEETEFRRDGSHGCIQLQEPAKLAAWMLRNTPGWNLDRVQQAMHHGRDNVRVNLAPTIPVLIVYQTVVVEEDGEVHFFHDIYDHDRTLGLELAQGYPYP